MKNMAGAVRKIKTTYVLWRIVKKASRLFFRMQAATNRMSIQKTTGIQL